MLRDGLVQQGIVGFEVSVAPLQKLEAVVEPHEYLDAALLDFIVDFFDLVPEPDRWLGCWFTGGCLRTKRQKKRCLWNLAKTFDQPTFQWASIDLLPLSFVVPNIVISRLYMLSTVYILVYQNIVLTHPFCMIIKSRPPSNIVYGSGDRSLVPSGARRPSTADNLDIRPRARSNLTESSSHYPRFALMSNHGHRSGSDRVSVSKS
ncbi:hypothetical protein F5Y03DRAFT_390963 [Xylaria venustula]|nr:hypothetical protein F5Y03DRAFT_390963 [Xylaria venustula]